MHFILAGTLKTFDSSIGLSLEACPNKMLTMEKNNLTANMLEWHLLVLYTLYFIAEKAFITFLSFLLHKIFLESRLLLSTQLLQGY